MTSSNGKIFCVTGPLCGELTGHRWIPLTKASDAEIWFFLWSVPWINGWVNNREAGDLRRHRVHYDAIVMELADASRCHEISGHLRVFVVKGFLPHGVPSTCIVWAWIDNDIPYFMWACFLIHAIEILPCARNKIGALLALALGESYEQLNPLRLRDPYMSKWDESAFV